VIEKKTNMLTQKNEEMIHIRSNTSKHSFFFL